MEEGDDDDDDDFVVCQWIEATYSRSTINHSSRASVIFPSISVRGILTLHPLTWLIIPLFGPPNPILSQGAELTMYGSLKQQDPALQIYLLYCIQEFFSQSESVVTAPDLLAIFLVQLRAMNQLLATVQYQR